MSYLETPNDEAGPRIGMELARLRLNAKQKQSAVAEKLGQDTSRISRIETGELLPEPDEVLKVAGAIGTEEAREYASYFKRQWSSQFEKPSFWHLSRPELAEAEEHLSKLAQFIAKPQTSEAAKAQAQLHRETIITAADYLRQVEHSIAFVGEIGVGKSSAICGLTQMLLKPDAKGEVPLSKRVVLEVGSGRTTLCEVQLRSDGKGGYGLVIQPHSPEEVFRSVSDFCASLVDALEGEKGRGAEDGDTRGVSEELGKALRNMAGLARKSEKGLDGKTVRMDPALELARACGGNAAELTAEVLKRVRLDQRTKTEFWFEGDDRASGMEKLRDLFASVNKGLCPDVSLPRRIDVTVPLALLGKRPFGLRIIDTKGVDDTAIRPDIRAYLDDPRTLTVLCSRFNSAPDSTMQQLMENLVMTGAERAISERVAMLVLARSQEVMDTQDDEGTRAETAEDGYRIKSDQVRWALSKVKGVKDLPVLFFDVLKDSRETVTDQLAGFVERMRRAQTQRIAEAGKAIDELIRRHGEAQSKEAQEKVRKRLRIFIEQHREIGGAKQRPDQTFLSTIGRTHVRTVWASTRRNGSWSGLDAYHLLGVGTAVNAQARSQGVFSGLDELLANMLGDPELEPAHDYLSELRRAGVVWRERFLNDATLSGREIYRAELYADDKVWDACVVLWGSGVPGYRNRVSNILEAWFEAHSHLEQAAEKRVQAAWREAFLAPLAALCGSTDLLENGASK